MDFENENRIMTPGFTESDHDIEISLRPKTLNEYIGQEKVKENLKIYIEAAKNRGDTLDHVLLYGPPGLGKTTLAGIIANEMGVQIRVTSGPAIEKPGDLAALLTNLTKSIVFLVQLKKCFIPLWKIMLLILLSAKARQHAQFVLTCHALHLLGQQPVQVSLQHHFVTVSV